MRKITLKFSASLTLGIALILLIFFLIEDYLYSLLNLNMWGIFFINLIFALIVSTIILIGIFLFTPILTDAMTTLRRLLRVENLSNPLLVKLSSEAPGTYHHSINVSTLAQKAARAIGADSLLVRTASYYHDLGKLSAPLEFVENQAGKEIPSVEDAEAIRKSAEKIIIHVENGVKMAEEAHLPTNVIDMIREHHGTTRAIYFFQIAKEKGLKIKKTDFRYAGPTPRSKESAILMLADCVEAITRATPSLNRDDIKRIVESLTEERKNDKQFKQSGLTDAELETIKRSLESTLNSIYHQRIEYK